MGFVGGVWGAFAGFPKAGQHRWAAIRFPAIGIEKPNKKHRLDYFELCWAFLVLSETSGYHLTHIACCQTTDQILRELSEL
eukprot:1641841-Amphidinium_carterae.1